jgi:hypothetical protein
MPPRLAMRAEDGSPSHSGFIGQSLLGAALWALREDDSRRLPSMAPAAGSAPGRASDRHVSSNPASRMRWRRLGQTLPSTSDDRIEPRPLSWPARRSHCVPQGGRCSLVVPLLPGARRPRPGCRSFSPRWSTAAKVAVVIQPRLSPRAPEGASQHQEPSPCRGMRPASAATWPQSQNAPRPQAPG